MQPAPRLKRFVLRAVPWRALFLVGLSLATVPALTIGLGSVAHELAGDPGPVPFPTPAMAALVASLPLAALLLVVSAASLRERSRLLRELRAELRRTNGRLASIIGATEDAIVLLDLHGAVNGWNAAAERLYGVGAEAAIGAPFESFICRPDAAAARDAMMVVVAADRRVTTESRHRRPDGEFPAIATWSAIREADGTVAGVSILVRDARSASAAEARIVEAVARLAEAERRVSLLTDSAPDAVVTTDDAGLVVGWNPAAEALFWLAAADATGRSIDDLISAVPGDGDGAGDTADAAGSTPADALPWTGRSGTTVRAIAKRAGDGPVPVEVSVSSYEDGGRTWYTIFVRDVTQRQAAEARAREHETRYRRLVEHLPGVVYRARVGRWAPVTYMSPHLERLLGYAPEAWVGVPGIWEEHIHPSDLERVLAADDQDAAAPPGEVRTEDREYRMRTRDGREIWVRDHADLERDPDGTPVAWNGFLTDITERKQLESELVRLAFHDALTGLANRALLNDRVTHALARRQPEAGAIAMLIVDLDDFKLVNDAHGHEAGDRLIVAAAERLKSCVRADATIARLGGDEFAILLDGLGDDAAALVVAQRIVRAFDKPIRIEGATLLARVSVGVAVDVTGTRSATWLMRSADTAMYEAKRMGKGRWQAYDPAAHLASAKRLVLEGELRRAVERRQFILVYQPITDLHTGDILGTEALIRWNHPTRGLIGPVEFISTLESTGLIEPVGRWVVDEACRQAAAWSRQLPSLAWTAVNVSAAQLRSDAFLDAVKASLAEHGLDPSRLTLEVTESLALDDNVGTIERLQRLRDLGCRIAVDDFGTGYSSLSYLRRLPIDRLKIDRAFVDGLGSDPEATAVTRAIVDLARSLRLSTVAEGIEQRHQADALLALGCELGQGFLFAKPLRAEDLTALVAGRQAAAALRAEGRAVA